MQNTKAPVFEHEKTKHITRKEFKAARLAVLSFLLHLAVINNLIQ
jgi:hypothetical protein